MGIHRSRLHAAFTALLMLPAAGCDWVGMDGPRNPGNGMIRWRTTLPVVGLPAADGDNAYFALQDHRVAALDLRSGSTLWIAYTDSAGTLAQRPGRPVRAGSVVVAGDGALYAYAARSGRPRWVFGDGGNDSPGVTRFAAYGSSVYAGSIDGRAYAIDLESGAELWRAEVSDAPDAVDVVGASAEVVWVIAKNRGRLCALNALSGVMLWKRDLALEPGSRITHSDVAFAPGPLVVVGFDDGSIIVVDGTSGVPSRTIAATASRMRHGEVLGIAITASTIVVSSASPAQLTAWSLATGAREWSMAPGFPVFGWYELSAGDGVVLTCMPTSALGAYDMMTGRQRWVRSLPSGPCRTPFVAGDMILVSAWDGTWALEWK